MCTVFYVCVFARCIARLPSVFNLKSSLPISQNFPVNPFKQSHLKLFSPSTHFLVPVELHGLAAHSSISTLHVFPVYPATHMH